MFFNYLKIGFRNILKYKVFSFINLFGLALAMSVGMLIILMMADQKSYDQFNGKKERTYRILSKRQESMKPNASSPFVLAGTLKANYPVVEEATTLSLGVGGDAVYNQATAEMRGFFADPAFFSVFSFELEKGNKEKALESPNSMVISSEVADLLFGTEDAIGKTVEFVDRGLPIMDTDLGGKESPPVNWGSYIVTGVIDTKEYKSHLQFDVLISSSSMQALFDAQKMNDITRDWAIYSKAYTYAVLAPGKTATDLNAALTDIVARNYAEIDYLEGFQLIEQKLTEITPGIFVGNPVSMSLPIEVYYFLGFLAVVIMFSACLNYTNLSTARSLTRAKEIGVRKVIGAQRKSLVFQFLAESMITAFIAMMMACILLFFIRSAFMDLWINQYLNFDLQANLMVFVAFVGLALVIGVIAGGYPALHLSGFQPIQALKSSESKRPGKFKLRMRKMLSASQFVVSLFFIITSILIFKQFKHFLDFQYEFKTESIVNIPLQGNTYEVLTSELETVPGVIGTSACSFIPATGMSHGLQVKKAGSEGEYSPFEILQVDENFLGNLELKLIVGRNLPAKGEAADNLVVVNEAAVEDLGYANASEILGQMLDAAGETVEVIGVAQNFRFQTPMMQDQIGPLVMRNQQERFSYINVNIAFDNMMGTVSKLEEKWKTIDPVHTFKYRFFEDELKKANQALGDLVTIIGYISFLAITIACLGLLGMATFTTERREKEVGVRKVLGAEDSKIALLLSKEFLRLLIISILISAPLSYLFNMAWLESFPNRVEMGLGPVLLGSGILLLLGIITIGSQTIRASRRKAVDSLRVD